MHEHLWTSASDKNYIALLKMQEIIIIRYHNKFDRLKMCHCVSVNAISNYEVGAIYKRRLVPDRTKRMEWIYQCGYCDYW